ncbi:MAG: EAL domain-containing protein [Rubrivivax sp.]|jgi:EAL domain-containing protein (putative c-di-GMP-specific phosphodiesterase class I)
MIDPIGSNLTDSALPSLLIDEAELAHAVRQERLELVYEVAWSALSMSVDSVEASATLQLPRGGSLSGPELMLAASQAGLDLEVDKAIMAHALCTACELAESGLGTTLSFSVSPRSLSDRHFVDRLLAMLRRSRLTPGQVAIDLNESMLMNSLDYSMTVLTDLREAGIRTSINEFGLGRSSPYWLARLPLSSVKISSDLLREPDRRGSSYGLVKCMATYGHALGLLVVAKGVETPEQLKGVTEAGVDVVQGPVVTRPLTAASLPRFLGTSSRVPRRPTPLST